MLLGVKGGVLGRNIAIPYMEAQSPHLLVLAPVGTGSLQVYMFVRSA